MHHGSYFLPVLRRIENVEFHVRLGGDVDQTINPLAKEGVFVEGNTTSILETMPINISINFNFMEKIFIGVNYSPE